MNISKHYSKLLFLFCLSAAFFLRIYQLDFFDIWFDEATAALEVRALAELPSFFKNLASLAVERDYLFLYHHVFLHYWKIYFGSSVLILRASSVLFGMLSLIAAYFMLKIRFGKRNAFLGFLFLCFSPIHIYYSRELKAYAALMFFAFMFYYFVFLFLQRGKRRYALGVLLFGSLAAYCHYIFLFFIAATLLYMIFSRKEPTSFLFCAGLSGVFCFLLLPTLLTLYAAFASFSPAGNTGNALTEFPVWFGGAALFAPFYTLKNFLIGYFYDFKNPYVYIALLLYLAAFVHAFIKDQNKFFMVVLFFVPFAVFMFSRFMFNFYIDRYFITLLPFVLVYMIKGFFCFKKEVGFFIMIIMLLISLSGVSGIYKGKLNKNMDEHIAVIPKTTGFLDLSSYLQENFREGDRIVHLSKLSVLPFKFYASKIADISESFAEEVSTGRVLWYNKDQQAINMLFYRSGRPIITDSLLFDGSINTAYNRVWVISGPYDNLFHPTRKLINFWKDGYQKKEFKSLHLFLYY